MEEYKMLHEICKKIGYEYFYTPGIEGFYFNSFDDNNLDEYISDGEIFYSGDTFYKKVNDLVFDSNQSIYNYTELDVRELLFTQEFMEKYINDLIEKQILTSSIEEHNIYYKLIKYHLDNPVEYLYNLIN